jgi:hypothetical protein
MSDWTECVIDAEAGCRDGLFCFCPIDGDIHGEFTVITGMNFLGAVPPDKMKLVAIVHPDGQEAVERFCEQYAAELEAAKSEARTASKSY